jgi:hypothetical protein
VAPRKAKSSAKRVGKRSAHGKSGMARDVVRLIVHPAKRNIKPALKGFETNSTSRT